MHVIGDVGEEERLALGSSFDDQIRMSSEVSKSYRLSTGISSTDDHISVYRMYNCNHGILQYTDRSGAPLADSESLFTALN